MKIDGNFSDSSDGNSEKCPICLLSFNDQEVGTPETCDHSFCADCIQEWSRNVNTCPVDRQTFSLILVRRRLNGKVIRQIPVEVRNTNEEEQAPEDPTYCEVCGMSDREDRLLLCDGCDLGFHLECLDPPLESVPLEEWFCTECVLPTLLQEDLNSDNDHSRSNRRHTIETNIRLIPRTSQSERVRAQIATNRNSTIQLNASNGSNSSRFDTLEIVLPGPSRITLNSNSSRTTRKKRKRRKTKKRKATYTYYYDIDEETGQKIQLKKLRKARKKKKIKKKKKISKRRVITPKTVKKRLAVQLGMCPQKQTGQNIPEVKIRVNVNNNIGFQRSQAGIPTLHLFGQRDQLDYFSESEDDDTVASSETVNVLSQARAAVSEAVALRRAARRKAALISTSATPATSASCDILGSILNSQEKLHSKNTIMSVNRDGTLNIESKKPNKEIIKPDNDLVDITPNSPIDVRETNDLQVTQAPMFSGRGGGGNRQPYFNRGGGGNYRGGGNMYDGGHYNYNQNNAGPRGRGFNSPNFNHPRENFGGYVNYHNHSGPANFRGRGPSRFPMRRPQLHQPVHQPRNEEPMELNLDEPIENTQQENVNENEDVDIYSDIETGSPVREDSPVEKSPARDGSLEPPPVPPFHIMGPPSPGDDSDQELIIDDTVKESDKYDPADPSNDTDNESNSDVTKTEESQQESSNSPQIGPQVFPAFLKDKQDDSPVEIIPEVSSSLPHSNIPKIRMNITKTTTTAPVSKEILKEAVKEVLQEHMTSRIQLRDDDMSDNEDSCPNFSIYSAESIDIAKETDSELTPLFAQETKQDIKDTDVQESDIPREDSCLSQKNKQQTETTMTCIDKENDDTKATDIESISLENKEINVEQKDPIKEQITETEIETHDEDIAEQSPYSDEEIFDSKEKDSDKEIEDIKEVICLKENVTESVDKIIENKEDSNDKEENDSLVDASKQTIKITPAFDPNRKTKSEKQTKSVLTLYDDSDLEEWEGKNDFNDSQKPDDLDNITELDKLTEAISEEERSYTPCLDEKEPSKGAFSDDDHNIGTGIGGLDTEMISEDERNDIFDESHDMKTISDGDALEINAKESELDMARTEDYEEGEIVEKMGGKKQVQAQEITEDTRAVDLIETDDIQKSPQPVKKKDKESEKEKKDKRKDDDKSDKRTEFKKLSKSNKERNYRDKEKEKDKTKKSPMRNKSKEDKENKKEKKREKKRDLERYCVRSLIQEKPRKDQFGRDEVRNRSVSNEDSRASFSPRRSRSRSLSRNRRSLSYERKKRRRRSRSFRRSRSRSFSRGYSPFNRGRSARRSRSQRRSRTPRRSRSPRRSKSPRHKKSRFAYRSVSRERHKTKKSEKSKKNKKRSTSRTRLRSRSPSFSKYRNRDFPVPARRYSFSKEWTPSWSRSPSPKPIHSQRHTLPESMSPSWTPPLHEKSHQTENLTVILNNDMNKKKKEKKKKTKEKNREELRKRKRLERTPPPSKEVFASGDNILVSVSFNKTGDDSGTREILGVKRKRDSIDSTGKKKKDKNKDKKKRGSSPKSKKKKNRTTVNIKPVAIIDLDRSPFKELTPSPKDIIVLSDSDHCEKGDVPMEHHVMEMTEEMVVMQEQNQRDSAPQSPNNSYMNSTGPKTPPEPQIKFLLSSKPNQIRQISNPLHDPSEEQEADIDPQEELEQRLNETLHKGPNTPPEPPTSPPSSPDAYDPFDPTKSRSPTPEPTNANPTNVTTDKQNDSEMDMLVDLAVEPLEQSSQSSEADKRPSPSGTANKLSPETIQARSPSTNADTTQDGDSSKNETNDKSPGERIGVVINQQVQPNTPFAVKPIAQTTAFSSGTSAAITSTPVISTALPRTNLFNTPSLVNTSRIQPSVPQRIILPTPSKSSPAKMSPAKPPIKSTPIKPMPTSKTMISKLPVPNVKPITPIRKGTQVKPTSRNQNGQNDVIDVDLDFESPYSPGSSDYEDLFEPPVESKSNNNRTQTKSSTKNTFDTLFGSSPVYRPPKANNKKPAAAAKPVKNNKKNTPTKRKFCFLLKV